MPRRAIATIFFGDEVRPFATALVLVDLHHLMGWSATTTMGRVRGVGGASVITGALMDMNSGKNPTTISTTPTQT